MGRIRARYLTARLPNPPVRPVRETFASYGSRERDVMGHFHFASSTAPSPWTALRVRWVPLYCFPTLSLRPFALYVAFLRSDYYGLFDCLEGLGDFGAGLPCLLPLSFTSLREVGTVGPMGMACPPSRTVRARFRAYGSPSSFTSLPGSPVFNKEDSNKIL